MRTSRVRVGELGSPPSTPRGVNASRSLPRCLALSLLLAGATASQLLGAASLLAGAAMLLLLRGVLLASLATLGAGALFYTASVLGFRGWAQRPGRCSLGAFVPLSLLLGIALATASALCFRWSVAVAHGAEHRFGSLDSGSLAALLRSSATKVWDACGGAVEAVSQEEAAALQPANASFRLRCAANDGGWIGGSAARAAALLAEGAVNAECLASVEAAPFEACYAGAWWQAEGGGEALEERVGSAKGLVCACQEPLASLGHQRALSRIISGDLA